MTKRKLALTRTKLLTVIEDGLERGLFTLAAQGGWSHERGATCLLGACAVTRVRSLDYDAFVWRHEHAQNLLKISKEEASALEAGYEGWPLRRYDDPAVYDLGAEVRERYVPGPHLGPGTR